MLKPIIGHRYRTHNGDHADIMGLAQHPNTVWSLQGNWYDAADGRFLSYLRTRRDPEEWSHISGVEPFRDLTEDLGPSPHFNPEA